jgi:DNA-damage-inducible protein D
MAASVASAFEQIKHTDEQGEYWLARELGKLLGYGEWRNFLGVIHEAMEVCRVQGGNSE